MRDTAPKNGKSGRFGTRDITPKMQQQVVEWAKDELATGALVRLWGYNSKQVTQCVYRAGIALREAVRAGLLK